MTLQLLLYPTPVSLGINTSFTISTYCPLSIALHFATRSPPLVTVQLAIGLAAIMIFALMPPATGKMTLISLDGTGRDASAAWIDSGAQLLGAGPLTNSLVVVGHRGTLARAALRHHVLLVAGSLSGCGGAVAS